MSGTQMFMSSVAFIILCHYLYHLFNRSSPLTHVDYIFIREMIQIVFWMFVKKKLYTYHTYHTFHITYVPHFNEHIYVFVGRNSIKNMIQMWYKNMVRITFLRETKTKHMFSLVFSWGRHNLSWSIPSLPPLFLLSLSLAIKSSCCDYSLTSSRNFFVTAMTIAQN